MSGDYDITGKIGPVSATPGRLPDWPMHSFDRPSRILWNAIAGELDARGWSEDQIKTWLQSKVTRWALDSDLGERLETLGRQYAGEIWMHKP